MRRRTSYPLCKDMNQLLDACRKMYVQEAMPLKWFASHSKENPLYVHILRAYDVNADLLTMMTILDLITERLISRSDFRTTLPGVKQTLGEFIKTAKINVQKLSKKGIRLTELYVGSKHQQYRNYLFYLLMKRTTNEKLPDFFARVMQTPSLFDKEVTRFDFKNMVHAKKPELDHLFLWTKFFGVNLAPKSSSMTLDRRWIIYYLFHSQLQALRDLSIDKYHIYSEVRGKIENELYILPSGLSVDNFFSMLERISQKYDYQFGWEPDRELYVGTGHMGNPKRIRISITGKLPAIVDKGTVSLTADNLKILMS